MAGMIGNSIGDTYVKQKCFGRVGHGHVSSPEDCAGVAVDRPGVSFPLLSPADDAVDVFRNRWIRAFPA